MAGEAIVALVPDLMFSVQLREAAAQDQYTVSLVGSRAELEERMNDVAPSLVVLDLQSAGADLTAMISAGKRAGARVIGYGPHVQTALLEAAEAAGCDAVYPNSKFKMDTREILTQWMGDVDAS